MSNKILVTYASRTGSTAEIAQAIGKTLAENGVQGVRLMLLEQKLNPQITHILQKEIICVICAICGFLI